MSAYASTPSPTASQPHAGTRSTFYTTDDGLAFADFGGIRAAAVDAERLGERATAVKVTVSDQRPAMSVTGVTSVSARTPVR